jgi:hypothetical protein
MEKLRFGGKIMVSEAQINANRANAQKSTGPRTEEGKTVAAQNAVKHGLLAQAAVLPGEDQEQYSRFHGEMMTELYPEGLVEEELAERIVDLSWRLRRAGQYQNAVFTALYDKYVAEAAEPEGGAEPVPAVPSDRVLGRMLLADFSGDRVLERMLSYERRIENRLYRTMAELRSMQQLHQQGRFFSARREAAGEQGRAWSPPGPAGLNLGRPTPAAAAGGPGGCGNPATPPAGVRSNRGEVQGQLGKTNPIGTGVGGQGSGVNDLTPALLRQTNPIGGGIGVQGGAPIAMSRVWEPELRISELMPALFRKTNPISAGANRKQSGRRPILAGAGGR